MEEALFELVDCFESDVWRDDPSTVHSKLSQIASASVKHRGAPTASALSSIDQLSRLLFQHSALEAEDKEHGDTLIAAVSQFFGLLSALQAMSAVAASATLCKSRNLATLSLQRAMDSNLSDTMGGLVVSNSRIRLLSAAVKDSVGLGAHSTPSGEAATARVLGTSIKLAAELCRDHASGVTTASPRSVDTASQVVDKAAESAGGTSRESEAFASIRSSDARLAACADFVLATTVVLQSCLRARTETEILDCLRQASEHKERSGGACDEWARHLMPLLVVLPSSDGAVESCLQLALGHESEPSRAASAPGAPRTRVRQVAAALFAQQAVALGGEDAGPSQSAGSKKSEQDQGTPEVPMAIALIPAVLAAIRGGDSLQATAPAGTSVERTSKTGEGDDAPDGSIDGAAKATSEEDGLAGSSTSQTALWVGLVHDLCDAVSRGLLDSGSGAGGASGAADPEAGSAAGTKEEGHSEGLKYIETSFVGPREVLMRPGQLSAARSVAVLLGAALPYDLLIAARRPPSEPIDARPMLRALLDAIVLANIISRGMGTKAEVEAVLLLLQAASTCATCVAAGIAIGTVAREKGAAAAGTSLAAACAACADHTLGWVRSLAKKEQAAAKPWFYQSMVACCAGMEAGSVLSDVADPEGAPWQLPDDSRGAVALAKQPLASRSAAVRAAWRRCCAGGSTDLPERDGVESGDAGVADGLGKLVRASMQVSRMAPFVGQQVLPSLAGAAMAAAVACAAAGDSTGASIGFLASGARELVALDSTAGDQACSALLAAAAWRGTVDESAAGPADPAASTAAAGGEPGEGEGVCQELVSMDELVQQCASVAATHAIQHMAVADEGFGHLSAALTLDAEATGVAVKVPASLRLPDGPAAVQTAVCLLRACRLCAGSSSSASSCSVEESFERVRKVGDAYRKSLGRDGRPQFEEDRGIMGALEPIMGA